ncbi:MAG: M20/M25/M40 family metallo-hydrolase [Gemmatimonadales bacterium]|nr:M20/M25/M40 family metallo-hydrolase [Gemmatimonadales bacterium]NIN11901.1 M20/M25/M40 family metallo-hydrolase [Gemmatimonadales bacterium]NIN50451.1 M20/M25/M40 family metallo-hydrolase [Gemmatimonadales bacterium]NIP07915.1 M20/M25/M40 family metallo-hydrolase [Gemmatimonadales bacterium]NIR01939.1 M20/M25/M40 family metallo-hydrolase [Gemmatimonadales bacterium]
MHRHRLVVALGMLVLGSGTTLSAQTFPGSDPVLQRVWQEGMENSHAYQLAQVLLDSIGPRLTGSPAHRAANDWAVAMYQSWGIDARNEQYGTWRGWERGISHIDLVEPRVRTLEGITLAWSPGTSGKVRGGVVILPQVADSSEFAAWLPQLRGKFVLTSFPQPTCRTDANWEEYAVPASFEKMKAERDTARTAWTGRMRNTGVNFRELRRRLEDAGALGIVTSRWSAGWGVNRMSSASTEKVPTLDLSCEDYGLVFRLAANGQNPVLQVEAEARFLGEVPVFNTIAEMRGSERPDEYVVLSAHYDSWDGASGATDNGTGSVTMMEAMRILKTVYPNPKRTIVAGLWSGEEQGLNGSRAFVADHPDIVEGLQALFNQDNGTGRVVNISMQGLTGAGAHFARWLAQVPSEVTRHINLRIPGTPGRGGSDYASFICAGVPSFSLFSLSWDDRYTWHTNRDTFDKVVLDDLKNNATLTAMLAYLASEDPERVPRDQRVMPVSQRTGEQLTWPQCRDGRRSWEERR